MIKFIVLLTLLFPVMGSAALSTSDKSFIAHKSIIKNGGFESGKTRWTASAGTFTAVTSGSNLLTGKVSTTWDAAASSDTLTYTAIAVPNGLKGKNGEAYCSVQTPSGTATHKLQAYDGTTVLSSVDVASSTNPVQASVNFVFPSSGNITLRLEAQADEPLIAIDDCYLGEATNIGSVAQAEKIGSIRWAATASCEWSKASNDWNDYAVDSDCAAPTVTGSAVAPSTKVPHIEFDSLGPGEYSVVVSGGMIGRYTSGSPVCGFRISDDTDSSAEALMEMGSGATRGSVSTLVGNFTITTAQANVSYKIQANALVGTVNSCAVNAGSADLEIVVYKVPSSSQIVQKADQTNRPWTAYTPTFTSLGTVSASECYWKRQGEDMLLRCGFTCGTTVGAEVQVSLPGSFQSATTVNSSSLAGQWTRDNTSTIHGGNVYTDPSQSYVTFSHPGTWGASNISPFTNTFGTSMCASTDEVRFTARVPIEGWVETNDAPLIKNSVVSSSSGVTGIEAAKVACEASSSITSQNGTWVSSVGNRSANDCTITFESSKFSAAPYCWAELLGDPTTNLTAVNFHTETSSGGTISCKTQNGATTSDCGDYDADIYCIGPK